MISRPKHHKDRDRIWVVVTVVDLGDPKGDHKFLTTIHMIQSLFWHDVPNINTPKL